MNIVFMGTPDFAVPCLKRIISDGHNVTSVFTREDKPVGRKKILTPPPIKVVAAENNIPVFQPEKLKGQSDIFEEIKRQNPDLIIVVAYGRILPEEILSIPKFGCINVHGSLLPRHRGASPIQWAIVCGDKVTGVTTMLMDGGVDTGDILLKEEISITDTDTYETLYYRMSEVGAKLLSETVFALEKGSIIPVKQPEEGATHAPIITKNMGQLDFSKTASDLDCLIRGFTPWPLSYFYVSGRRYKIYSAAVGEKTKKTPGTLYYSDGRVFVACGNGSSLQIIEICPDGSKKMDAAAFINGRFIENGTVIELV